MVTTTVSHDEDFEIPAEVAYDFAWMEFAACYGTAHLYTQDDNPFFVEGRGKTYPTAREFCAICSVVVDCLIEGLDSESGFRGGCSPIERVQIRLALDEGGSLEVETEAIWIEHRANRRGGRVPDKRVWEDWIT